MYGMKTSHQAWKYLTERYASQSRSYISKLKRQLQSLQQGSKSCTEYLNTAKQWADQLSAVGKPVEDDDLISFTISGLNPMYNSFVAAFSFHVHDRTMTFANFQAELLSNEILIQSQQHQALTPETGNFALYTNKQGPSNFNHQNSPTPRGQIFLQDSIRAVNILLPRTSLQEVIMGILPPISLVPSRTSTNATQTIKLTPM